MWFRKISLSMASKIEQLTGGILHNNINPSNSPNADEKVSSPTVEIRRKKNLYISSATSKSERAVAPPSPAPTLHQSESSSELRIGDMIIIVHDEVSIHCGDPGMNVNFLSAVPSISASLDEEKQLHSDREQEEAVGEAVDSKEDDKRSKSAVVLNPSILKKPRKVSFAERLSSVLESPAARRKTYAGRHLFEYPDDRSDRNPQTVLHEKAVEETPSKKGGHELTRKMIPLATLGDEKMSGREIQCVLLLLVALILKETANEVQPKELSFGRSNRYGDGGSNRGSG
ncbi:unnamed protein product [Cyprideis torosa]|uniref:Uncharacterized protein n=1 Tax=Cyprideis torosa TaxID=163714 RepID=A0A7R8WIE9_9CRUS|nr:unnamed protein product [Cyprideis torosa]CAG0900679.1 unnamed protein product [Cyprideis torosa]